MFNILLRPIELLMNRLSYIKKFMVILIAGGALVMLINYFLLSEINDKIKIAEAQLVGAQYNNQLKDLLRDSQQHRGLSNAYLSGDETVKGDLEKLRASVDNTIQSISTNRVNFQQAIQDENTWNSIVQQWNSIKANFNNYTEETSFSEHTVMVDYILALIKDVGNQSGLILDTELDRYYLIDATINELPALSEDMGQLRAQGAAIINHGYIRAEERIEILTLQRSALMKLEDLIENLQVALQANPKLVDELRPLMDTLQTNSNIYLDLVERMFITEELQLSDARQYFAIATSAINSGFNIYEFVSDYVDEAFEQNLQTQKQYRYILVIMTLGVSIVVLYFFAGFYVSVIKSINTLNEAASAVAKGDLTVRAQLETTDELSRIGRAFNEMADSLAELIASSKEAANQVASSSVELSASASETMNATNEIAHAVQDVASGAESQVESANESSRAMEEMAQGITRIAESASIIAESAGEMSTKASHGNDSLQATVEQMGEIQKDTDKTANTVSALQQDAEEIGSILQLITDISSQTNLLALNAAIEAARAGEAGRGFAVVADEIRKLADQTGQATGQISGLIEKIQMNVKGSADSMASSKQQVDLGIANINAVNKMFKDIIDVVNDVSRQIEELSSVSEEMAAGSEEISASVQELANIAKHTSDQTQNIAASSEEQLAIMQEVAKSAESLEGTANELSKLVSRFKV
ncbi:methyl-accepting chemotaxis protein [Desulfuribacillus alkaliarsenatis]|uniref:Chemotaxis protein n=1 Tax=Desulfuribacillus alkaliarsenatis TaxID=766136 RepID=A0A1E5G222_9FIRM|nr:methyl-accepting chemotaxis protein [Desulfuribacillus alkaliarsenatis]OEF97021.1 hypothetical protein BHF68_05320 [Desulfuribacillus alkaliarsenatis]